MSFNNISGVEHARNQEYVHRVNVEKGWFDRPVTLVEAMGLLITEVVEVGDAYSAEGLRGGWQAPEQMASEFADIYIRLADYCSRFTVDLGVAVDVYRHSYERRPAKSFDGVLFELVRRARDVIEAYRTHGLESIGAFEYVAGPEIRKALAYLYLQLQDTCDEFGVDIMKAFDLKMVINSQRPYRHGNKHA